jgi:protein-L-isoaspartate(D-aspartate) O-methyltransferase
MDEKEYMVRSIILHNQRYAGKRLEKIINAVKLIDRKFFVPRNLEDFSYHDEPLPIGHGQTISQPSVVVTMLLLAELKEGLSALEVGAGSGWNASLIQYLVYPGKVIAVERISKLTENAKKNILRLKKYLKKEKPKEVERLKNLRIKTGDALDEKSGIWQEKYDRIIITAGIPADNEVEIKIEKMAEKLLKKNGILVCPRVVGSIKIYKKNKKLKLEETQQDYVFVPLLQGSE